MEVLISNTVVSTVGLRANGIGPLGGQAIANVLRHNTALTGLDLGSPSYQ